MAKLAVHGTEAGYRAEIDRGNACELCANAHREYNRQFSKAGKAAGVKIARDQVVPMGNKQGGVRESRVRQPVTPLGPPQGAESAAQPGGSGSVGDRLASAMASVLGGSDAGYVGEDDDSGLRAVDPDPEPAGEWAEVTDSDYVINAAGLKQIQENMGTYLSVIGMTAEMLDPYCGPVLAENFNNMIERWSKVIVHYPKAAALFLDGKGGLVFAWIGAIQATWPVLMAIYDHHLAGNVKVDRASGAILRKTPGNHAQAPSFDATTPPMPDNFQYSAR